MAHLGRRKNRPGKLILDWREPGGRRCYREFPDTPEGLRDGQIELGAIQRRAKRGEVGPDERITVEEYAKRWLRVCRLTIAPTSWRTYDCDVRVHILPAFGTLPLARLSRGMVQDWVLKLLESGLARVTATKAMRTLGTMCQSAVDESMLVANPTARLGRKLRLGWNADEIKALSAVELARVLDASKRVNNPVDDLTLFAMAHTGIRLGEACGLQRDDLDRTSSPVQLRIERQLRSDGQVAKLKAAASRRRVDVSTELLEALERACATRGAEALAAGKKPSSWLLRPDLPDSPRYTDALRVRRRIEGAMRRATREAGLSDHFTPHCLRHTWITLQLSLGRSPQWVQQQAGHATFRLTVDVYGRWAKPPSEGAADAFAAAVQAARPKVVDIR